MFSDAVADTLFKVAADITDVEDDSSVDQKKKSRRAWIGAGATALGLGALALGTHYALKGSDAVGGALETAVNGPNESLANKAISTAKEFVPGAGTAGLLAHTVARDLVDVPNTRNQMRGLTSFLVPQSNQMAALSKSLQTPTPKDGAASEPGWVFNALRGMVPWTSPGVAPYDKELRNTISEVGGDNADKVRQNVAGTLGRVATGTEPSILQQISPDTVKKLQGVYADQRKAPRLVNPADGPGMATQVANLFERVGQYHPEGSNTLLSDDPIAKAMDPNPAQPKPGDKLDIGKQQTAPVNVDKTKFVQGLADLDKLYTQTKDVLQTAVKQNTVIPHVPGPNEQKTQTPEQAKAVADTAKLRMQLIQHAQARTAMLRIAQTLGLYHPAEVDEKQKLRGTAPLDPAQNPKLRQEEEAIANVRKLIPVLRKTVSPTFMERVQNSASNNKAFYGGRLTGAAALASGVRQLLPAAFGDTTRDQ